MDIPARRIVVTLDETLYELDRAVVPVQRRVVAAAVIANPFAGRHVEDLAPLAELGGLLGRMLAERALAVLTVPTGAGPASAVQGYGKAAIVGTAGEVEHAAAILHPRFGKAVRATLDGASAIMPSAAKRAGPGASLDVPLHSIADMWSFDHFDAIPFAIADAPAADEILVALALADRGRPLARIATDT